MLIWFFRIGITFFISSIMLLLLSFLFSFQGASSWEIFSYSRFSASLNFSYTPEFPPEIRYSHARRHHWSFLCLLSCSQESKWAWEDSNLRPHAYQACALTTCATSPSVFRLRSSIFYVVRRPLVEMRRFELLTPCLQGRCSPNWATPPFYRASGFLVFSFHFLKVHLFDCAH